MQLALLLVTVCAAGFVWTSASSLPSMVASHFGPSGAANGFMPRASFVHFMFVLVVLVPIATGLLPGLLLNVPGIRINLPNRDYWLAPPRRAATIAELQRLMAGFAVLLVLFLSYVHWLTIRANQAEFARSAQRLVRGRPECISHRNSVLGCAVVPAFPPSLIAASN